MKPLPKTPALLAALLLVSSGCPDGAQRECVDCVVATVVGTEETFGSVLAVGTNDQVYWVGEYDLRTLDAASPRDIALISGSAHGLRCRILIVPDWCGVAISGTAAFVSVNSQLVATTTSSSGGVAWVLDGAGYGPPEISSSAIVSGKNSLAGSVRIVTVSSGGPAVVSQIESSMGTQTRGDSLYVVTTSDEFIALSLQNPVEPEEYARIELPFLADEGTSSYPLGDLMHLDGADLFLLAGFSSSFDETWPCHVSWMTLDTALGTAVVRGRSGTYRGCVEVLSHDEYVALAYDGRSRPGVDVFRLEPDGAFRRTAHVAFGEGDLIVDIALDARRGLLYVARTNTLDVLDFGLLTTGEPSVPDP